MEGASKRQNPFCVDNSTSSGNPPTKKFSVVERKLDESSNIRNPNKGNRKSQFSFQSLSRHNQQLLQQLHRQQQQLQQQQHQIQQQQQQLSSLDAQNFQLVADKQRISKTLNEHLKSYNALFDRNVILAEKCSSLEAENKEKDERISNLHENHGSMYSYFEDKINEEKKGHEVALQASKEEDIAQRKGVIEGLLKEVKDLRVENEHQKEVTQVQTQAFDRLKKQSEEKLREAQEMLTKAEREVESQKKLSEEELKEAQAKLTKAQNDAKSLKESLTQAQFRLKDESQRFKSLIDEERKKGHEELESLRNRHEEEKAEAKVGVEPEEFQFEVSGVTILKTSNERLVKQLQQEMGQLKTENGQLKHDNEGLKVESEKQASELRERDDIVESLRQELEAEKKLFTEREFDASKKIITLRLELESIRAEHLRQSASSKNLQGLLSASELRVKNLGSENFGLRRSLERLTDADKKQRKLIDTLEFKNQDTAKMLKMEMDARAEDKSDHEREMNRKMRQLNMLRQDVLELQTQLKSAISNNNNNSKKM